MGKIAAVLLSLWIVFIAVTSNGKVGFCESRIDKIVDEMSLEEKVGQVMIGFFEGPTISGNLERRVRQLHLGGVILYSVSGNIVDVGQVTNLNENLQKLALSSGSRIPLFIGVDQEGGTVTRLTKGFTVFPGNMALGAAGSEELTRQAAMITARELRAVGINMNFAPVVDVNNNPANPVIGIRSFGSTPQDVARLGTAAVNGYTTEKVIATVKHFPGHGDTNTDSHLGLPVIKHSRQHLNNVEMFPFKAAIKAGVPAVMTAHVVVPALDESNVPATLSAKALNLLREELGFDGIIITDSLTMGAIVQRWGLEEASVRAFQAGADVLLFGADRGHGSNEQERVYQALLEAVKSGRIPIERLEDSVRRILEVKERFEILDNPFPHRELQPSLASQGNLAVAERIAEQSLTLVKNRDLLPLEPRKNIPIVWPKEMANELRPVITECPYLKPYYVPLQANAEDMEQIRKELQQEAVVVIGTFDLARNTAWAQVVKSLKQDKIVAVAMRSPYDLLQIPNVAAYIATYSDRPVSARALGKLLKGDIRPRGHLPVDLPHLYPRGWGMTEF